MCERYPSLEWRRQGEESPRPFACNTWKCRECEPGKRRAIVEIVRRWCVARDVSRAVTLTLDPSRVTAPVLQRFMAPGKSAAALMDECAAWTYRRDKKRSRGVMVQTYAGGSDESREALRAAFVRLINYIWNKARTRMKHIYPELQYVRVVELHDDSVRPHLHLLVSQYVPRDTWRQVWTAAGGGANLDIRRIKDRIDDAARYLMKYLTKAAYSSAPETWPRYCRRIVVSRGLSLTLNPEEKAALDEYQAREHDPAGPCIAGWTPEGLEGGEWEQCRGCVWKARKVCRWRPPGVPRWELYDTRRGVPLFPVPVSNEELIDRAWEQWAKKYAHNGIPRWCRDDRGIDPIAADRMFHLRAVPVMVRNMVPFQVDNYLHRIDNRVEREGEV